MWKVSYLHYTNTTGLPYRVSRTFDTRQAAQEFIDTNAMVCPLPGVKLQRMPIDPELFKRTAPKWNCVDYPNDGPHYPSKGNCLWCGMTKEEITAEWERENNGR